MITTGMLASKQKENRKQKTASPEMEGSVTPVPYAPSPAMHTVCEEETKMKEANSIKHETCKVSGSRGTSIFDRSV